MLNHYETRERGTAERIHRNREHNPIDSRSLSHAPRSHRHTGDF